jgi:lipid II:glycine glycyltransferase (peptidoglycan interpeptide bridge formation enzyme)
MAIKVKICTNSDLIEWNTFASNCPYGDVLQFWQWGELKKTEGWRPFRIAIVEQKNEVEKWLLAAQILLKPVKFLGNYAYVPHGPIFYEKSDLELGLPKLRDFLILNNKMYSFLCLEIEPKIGVLVNEEKEEDFEQKTLRQNPNIKPLVDREVIQIFAKAGYKITNRNIQPIYKLYYDLEQSEDQLMSQCQKNTRYNIKLAQKKDVKVQEFLGKNTNIDIKLKVFYDLISKTQKQKNTYLKRSFSSFQQMFNFFSLNSTQKNEPKSKVENIDSKPQNPKNSISILEIKNSNSKVIFRDGVIIKKTSEVQKPEKTLENLNKLKNSNSNISLFEASYNEEIIAMNVSFRTNFWSSTFYASSSQKHPDIKAPYLLQWNSILQAKKYGSKIYDFWGIFPNKKNYNDNKISFGGVRVDNIGILSLELNPIKFKIWNFGMYLKTFFKK